VIGGKQNSTIFGDILQTIDFDLPEIAISGKSDGVFNKVIKELFHLLKRE
jgi:hypothetical protein